MCDDDWLSLTRALTAVGIALFPVVFASPAVADTQPSRASSTTFPDQLMFDNISGADLAADPGTGRVYLLQAFNHLLSAIDPSTGVPGGQAFLTADYTQVLANGANRVLLVNTIVGFVTVLNATDFSMVAEFAIPAGALVDADDDAIYVASTDGSLTVRNSDGTDVRRVIDLGGSVSAMVADPAHRRVVLAVGAGPTLLTVDSAATVISPAAAVALPGVDVLAVDPTGTALYAAGRQVPLGGTEGWLARIDPTTLDPQHVVPLDFQLGRLAADSASHLWGEGTNGSDWLGLFDPTTLDPVTSTADAAYGDEFVINSDVAVDPAGRGVWMFEDMSRELSLYAYPGIEVAPRAGWPRPCELRAVVDQQFRFNLAVVGTGSATVTGALPDGVTFDGYASFFGDPTQPGVSTVTLTWTNSAGTDTLDCTITTDPDGGSEPQQYGPGGTWAVRISSAFAGAQPSATPTPTAPSNSPSPSHPSTPSDLATNDITTAPSTAVGPATSTTVSPATAALAATGALTGRDTAHLAVAAIGLVFIGSGLIVATRRRRPRIR